VDDRILFAPWPWAPTPEVVGRWPAVRVLLQRLREKWPLDLVRWPTIKGETDDSEDARETMRHVLSAALRAEHHIVANGMGDYWLEVLARNPPQSVTATTLVASPGTLLASGGSLAESSVRVLRMEMSRRPGALLPALFQGAEPGLVESLVHQVEETTDQLLVSRLIAESLEDMDDHSGRWVIDVPALYLAPAALLPGHEPMERAFKTFFPRTAVSELALWGLKMQEEDAGDEFADKVIPFIQKVIAERAKVEPG
jgi:hypothetical protein